MKRDVTDTQYKWHKLHIYCNRHGHGFEAVKCESCDIIE